MRSTILACILLAAPVIATRGAEPDTRVVEPATHGAGPATRSSSPATTRPVVSVFYEHSYPPPDVTERRRLIIAVYSDGTLRWSDNQATGGRPYREGRVSPERVQRLLDDLDALGLFTDPDVTRHRIDYGPDSSFTVVAAQRGQAKQRLASWHDPAPRGEHAVVTERGIVAVQRGQPPPEPSPSYKRFTQVWSAARKLIYDVLPGSDAPIDERVFDVGRQTK